MSDWPYEDDRNPPKEPGVPDWHCPADECQCHPVAGEAEEYEFSVMLYAHDGSRMPGARCRLHYQGKILNEDEPNADGEGWITAVVPRVPASVLVEWAPANTPLDPTYPYRVWYYVDIDKHREENVRRRLHNLGFSRRRSLADNVRDFQTSYGYPRATGRYEDIEADLDAYHDEGRVPERKLDDRNAAPGGGAQNNPPPTLGKGALDKGDKGDSAAFVSQLRSDQKAKLGPDKGGAPAGNAGPSPAKSPAAPASKGKQVIRFGSVMFPNKFPTPKEALQKKEAYYEFVRIFSESSNAAGFFWIFGEALMWPVPNTEAWKGWTESYSHLPHTPRVGSLNKTKRMRLCRLPCRPYESQQAADILYTTQKELLSWTPDKMGETLHQTSEEYKASTSKDAAPSLLPTPKLYDRLYLSADVRVQYQYVDNMKRGPENMSNEYNYNLNQKVDAALAKAALKTPFKSLGTPGKIWAIDKDLEVWRKDPDSGHLFVCSINYGFHKGHAKPDVEQTPGRRHDNIGHIDYSQIFIAVAGWCLVLGPKNKNYVWMRTADVYINKELAGLVTDHGGPTANPPFYTGTTTGRNPKPRG